MHCELVVPGLLAAAQTLRLPATELLLAKGRSTASEPRSVERWLEEAFELESTPVPAGALTMLSRGTDAREGFWARADPVHLRLLRDRVVLVPGAAFSVSREEAEALCDAVNRHFSGEVELHAAEPLRWCVRLAQPLELPQDPAVERAGVDVRPGAPGDALANEIQMLLHAHPVNEAREARGELPINGLWFWGGGALPHEVGSSWQSVSAEDPVALGLAQASKTRSRVLPASAAAWLERVPEEGRHLILLDALRPLRALGDAAGLMVAAELLEKAWFVPLLDALRSERIGMLTVHVPDGRSGVSFETIRADLRRFWRRPRPLGDYEQ
jgi:hypothetical protein